MHDSYLFLTPVLTFLVVALVGFVGCDALFGIDHVDPYFTPRNLMAQPGNKQVTLDWAAPSNLPNHEAYRVKRRDSPTASYEIVKDVLDGTHAVDDTPGLVNGQIYYYRVWTLYNGTERGQSDEVSVVPSAPGGTPFVTAFVPGVLRNNFSGWAGMMVLVGPSAMSVTALGRAYSPGNSGSHDIKIVDQATKADVPGSMVTVTMTAGAPGEFQYATLSAPVMLDAGRTYYVVSREINLGDQFYDHDTEVQTTTDASVVNSVYGDALANYFEVPPSGYSYGPVNFQY